MASRSKVVKKVKVAAAMAVVLLGLSIITEGIPAEAATWCVARSDVSDTAIQTSLDYACGGGADCSPILPSGLCYLPNNVQAHASYAFNSYYQRKSMAPGSCDFSGTATIARTDPSYGSCVYPSSLSTAGGTGTPTLNALPPPGPSGNRGLTPGLEPEVPSTTISKASLGFSIITTISIAFFIFVVLS
ncbi:hypothetical protein F0562_000089 [Nyssa sinensis]|uniref:X8 domain-containing protein n=1 Tax=Nyssa sinensis TaxID=561372 RepID=A0A5J5BZ46_9ASTE|nr:hypothetical protein F0562_000089 [Nyssa sinensis]